MLVAVFALSVIAAVVKGATVKGLISAGLGLMFAMVGYDVIAGNLRFTFGMDFLEDGVPFIQALVVFLPSPRPSPCLRRPSVFRR